MKRSESSQSAARGKLKPKAGTIISLDGTRQITVEEFDRLFDEGSDEIDEFINWSKTRRVSAGGARPGAGRKPGTRKAYHLRLRPETHRKLKAEAARRKVSLSQVADEKLNEVLQ
ncbi:MAG: hypothetical protein WD490_08225 [Opitutales bacterium]